TNQSVAELDPVNTGSAGSVSWHHHPLSWLRECAWQESNLLPFGPEPNALSGELQAREYLVSLNSGPRGPIRVAAADGARACCLSERHASGIQPGPESISAR